MILLVVCVSVCSRRLFCKDCCPLGACWLSRIERSLLFGGYNIQFYRNSNQGHGICPLYIGCPPFGGSVIIETSLYCDLYFLAGAPTQEKRIQKLADRVRELPVANYCTLKALIQHLKRYLLTVPAWSVSGNTMIVPFRTHNACFFQSCGKGSYKQNAFYKLCNCVWSNNHESGGGLFWNGHTNACSEWDCWNVHQWIQFHLPEIRLESKMHTCL